MHTSHGRSRRQGNKKAEDSEAALPLLVSRVDEPRSESYSRLPQTSHRTESYRTSHTPKRPYDNSREASSSRTLHDSDDWRTSDVSHHSSHDRYNYTASVDTYHSGSLDTYNAGESRDSDGWSSHSVTPGREWTPRYDHGRSTPSHPEPASWNAYDNRTPSYDQWQPEDGRSFPPGERNLPRTATEDRQSDRDTSGWHKEERRDSPNKMWPRDNGWESRRRDNRGKERDESRRWNNTRHEDSHRPAEERSWEPAPTWSSNRRENQGPRNQNGHKNHHSNKNSKGGKKGHAHNKQKRDWRTDDGNFNKYVLPCSNHHFFLCLFCSWPKRDSSKAARTSTKRRYPDSHSRSRSRSPAESFQSHRSSRGRSRSRSISPRRKRRHSSPTAPHNRTPGERGRKSWNRRQERTFSKSPSGARRVHDTRVARRRSLSSASDTSRSRSTSRSPADRPRAVHRLPPATSLMDTLSAINISRPTGMRPPRDIPYRNGKNQANGKHANVRYFLFSLITPRVDLIMFCSGAILLHPTTATPLSSKRPPCRLCFLRLFLRHCLNYQALWI
jgi:hypothetical protein